MTTQYAAQIKTRCDMILLCQILAGNIPGRGASLPMLQRCQKKSTTVAGVERLFLAGRLYRSERW